MKSQVFTLAHQNKANYSSFSMALKYAWAIIKLKSKMKHHVVLFSYKKVDGSIRQAYGTLKGGMLPASKGTGRKSSAGVLLYFDIQMQGYRSCKVENILF